MSPEQDEAIPDDELEREALEARPSADDGAGIDLCPSCLQGVPYADNLCPHCGAPVSGTAGIAPWERTLAEGFIYRKAVAKPGKPIVLIGVWVIFFPAMLMNGIWLGLQVKQGDFGLGSTFVLLGFVISVAALYQATRNYYRIPSSSQAG